MSETSLLSVRGLKTVFHAQDGAWPAVDGVDFSVAKGEVLGLVGESGSGKSVTGFSLVQLIDPPGEVVAGQVLFDGDDLCAASQERLRQLRGDRIAMIFQDPLMTLNPVLSIGEQMSEAILEHRDCSRQEALDKAAKALARVGISSPETRLKQYPHEFSGGMRQRVAIATALLNDPDLIIADEPTTALDVSVQAQIISLIKRLGRDHGTAVMLVTHDMGVIAETSDRVAVMYSGRIAEIGPVQDVVQNPLHPYAKGLMGAIPTLAGEDKRLVQIPGSMPRLSAIPPGCSFNPRCSSAFDRCRVERPEPLTHGSHAVACHLFDSAPREAAKETAA